MIKKKNVDWEANEAMKQWGYRFEKLHGELPLQRLTDHVYDLCELSAQEAEAADDHVLDYLRKRAVFYATSMTSSGKRESWTSQTTTWSLRRWSTT